MKKLSRILCVLLCAVLLFSVAACAKKTETTSKTDENTSSTAIPGEIASETSSTENTSTSEDVKSDIPVVENKTKFDTTKHVFVTFTIKDRGEFQVELYPEYAPNTVTNFTNLADSGYYDGLKFHRVVDDFMAQGGINYEEEADSIFGEFSSNGFEQNTLKHKRGVISMARATDPNSASGQFFICYDTCDFLDGNYAAFGKVTYGMDVLDSFLDVERAMNSMGELATPLEDIIIEKAVVSQ